jgi:hypothetical protein
MTEYVFFHRPSRTLLLTDFIETFQREKVDSAFVRCRSAEGLRG